jgi:hypothetical protein
MLTAHWTFEPETIKDRAALDATGSGLSAALDESVALSPGHRAGALAFDGHGRAVIPAAPQLVLSQLFGFSLAFFVRVDEAATGEWRGVLYKPVAEQDARGLGLWLYPDALRIRVQLFTAKGPEYADSHQVLELGEWAHVAMVVDPDELYLYVDGELDSAIGLENPVVTPAGPIFLGRDPTGLGFTGLLDDFRVYTTALTGEQVRALAEDA